MRTPLYVITPGAHIGYQGGRLRVRYPEPHSQIIDLPIRSLSSLTLFGPSSLSHHTLDTLLRLSIACHFFSANGRFIGRICPVINDSPKFTPEVLELSRNVESALLLGKWFAQKKLHAMLGLTEAIAKNSVPQDTACLKDQVGRLKGALAQLSEAPLSIEEIRGIEGRLTKMHYQVLNAGFKKHRDIFTIARRTRRPPQGPHLPSSRPLGS